MNNLKTLILYITFSIFILSMFKLIAKIVESVVEVLFRFYCYCLNVYSYGAFYIMPKTNVWDDSIISFVFINKRKSYVNEKDINFILDFILLQIDSFYSSSKTCNYKTFCLNINLSDGKKSIPICKTIKFEYNFNTPLTVSDLNSKIEWLESNITEENEDWDVLVTLQCIN